MINGEQIPLAGESNLATATNNLSIMCVACKSGYSPSYSNLTQFNHVFKCDQIKNCAEKGDNFNECKRCENGYSFGYENHKTLKDRCI